MRTGEAQPFTHVLANEAAFEGYSPVFLTELVARRMCMVGAATSDAYHAVFTADPTEREALRAMLPIVHTCFFRDDAMWTHLAERIVPRLIEESSHTPDARIRAWVPGCATGQEVYALCILFAEQIGRQPLTQLQLFGTDLSPAAIEAARWGRYDRDDVARVPPPLRTRYFHSEGSGFSVDSSLREAVGFAARDLLHDPPHSNLELIMCRNTLIYFSRPIRRRLLAAFHYGLRPGGVLVLGSTELLLINDDVSVEWELLGHGVYRKVACSGVHPWIQGGCTVLPRTPLETAD